MAKQGRIIPSSSQQGNFIMVQNLSFRAPYYHNGAYLMIRKPSILFVTTTSSAGIVDFFIRARSVNHGDGFFDTTGINSTGISVSGEIGFGTMYEQKFTIPESSLTNDWWIITIQRQGLASTYTDAVVVTSVALSY